MSHSEEDQFARDVARAIELSRVTAAEENTRRKRLGLLPLLEDDGGVETSMPSSNSAPNLINSGRREVFDRSPRPPAPSPTPASQQNTITDHSTAVVRETVTVRARPRPTSGSGRAVSPAALSMRRSGFIETNDSNKLTLPSPNSSNIWDPPRSPRTSSPFNTNPAPTNSVHSRRDHVTLWEDFEDSMMKPMDFSTASNPFEVASNVAPPQSTQPASSPFHDLGDDFLQVHTGRDRADSSTNLIALSPMNQDRINKHYKLDLDSLFAGGTAAMESGSNGAGFAPSSLHNHLGNTANTDLLSVSWPSSNGSQSIARPSSNAKNLGGAGMLPPLPQPAQTQNPFQSSVKSTNTSFDINGFFDDIWSGAPSSRTQGNSMPTGRAPSPFVPPVPARIHSTSTKKTSLQIKREGPFNSDLLDLGKDLKIPEVSSLNLFDPLFSPSDEDRRGFEDQFTDLSERLSARISYNLTEAEDDMEAQLQDPFSYEELSMALMTTSTIQGDDVFDDDDDRVEAEAVPVYESISSPTDETMTPSAGDVPTRPPKPRSLSITPKSLRVTDNETMDEFTAFSVMVARLKADYKYDDKYTNLGILFSPTVNIPTPTGVTVNITVHTEMSAEPIELKTDVSTSVEIIIWNVMSNISSDFLEVSVDDYILKVFSRSEFLVNDSNLSDYAYTHNCLKLKESIRFSLHVVASLPKPFLRKPGDDEEPIYMIKDELHGDKSYKVQPKDLKLLYELFSKHLESVNKLALENGLTKLNVTVLLQSVKAVTSHLLGAETLEIQTAIKQLQSTLHQTDNSIYDDSQFIELMDDFQRAMESLCTGVRNLITMYCATFHVRYCPPDSPSNPREIKEVTDSLENILVHIGSVHRIPAKIRGRFDHYKAIVSLYYAGHKVSEHTSTDVYSSLDEPRNSDTIYFDQWLELTDFPMCLVPVETRVVFTLCAMNTSQPVGGSGANTLNKWNNIGWVSFMLFDFKRNVTQGSKLLSLWHGIPNVTGATGSNIWQPNTTLLQVNLPDFGFELRFPFALVESSNFTPTNDGMVLPDEDDLEQALPDGDLKELNTVLSKDDKQLNADDKEFMWSKRDVLRGVSEALPKVLLSAPQFNYTGIHLIQATLESWTTITTLEALRLLLTDFPCQQIRTYAVRCLKRVSSDEMCDYLPQLVQALKFENYHDSALARLLLERSITSVRLAQQLYWFLKEGASQPAYRERYKLLFGGLVSVMGKSLREELEQEELLVKQCNNLADQVKEAKGDKDKVMSKEILSISDLLHTDTLRLPTNPGHEVNGLDSKLCTYFNSFTLPLKLVFKNVEHGAPNHYLMYKVGDDLRQDMIVMQLINIMDKLWLQNDLDMRLVTFTCLPTGDKRGMVELINECETLRKIQTSSGITGSFKDQPLANWLQKHNPTHSDYNRAVENFTLSCAGYCVATYILGIGDRHNDNIMVKRTGHIFHIDFSKFLGDAQMFGNFKRDRTPFVLTPDMAYVINGGDKPTKKFQNFIDLCCEAFNAIRDNAEGIVTLLRMMTSSGIKGVTLQAIQYVRTALLPGQTNTEATASFTRMIEDSLKSKFVQFNFFIHNLAQLKFSSHSDGELLSFIPTTYSMATDGRIINVEIFDYQKRYHPEKHYIYIIKVHRERQKQSTLVYRRYSEFQEFYGKLVGLFPLANIPYLPGSIVLGRTHVQKVAEKRKAELETFLRELLMQTKEISEHDLLYTFFHPMLRDETETAPAEDSTIFKDAAGRPNIRTITGEVKLSIHYKQHSLHIMVMHVKGLGNETGDRPNPYVKLYLLPDPIKMSKRKTKVSRSTYHPTYNEMFEYRLPMSEVKQRTLQVTVWSAELTGNEFLGAIHLNLYDKDISKEIIDWHQLSNLHRIRS